MDRREALSMMGMMFGGTIVGANAFLTGCSRERSGPVLRESDIRFLNEIGETIIPATSTSGGAKAAEVGEFMNEIITDFYSDEEVAEYTDGIGKVDDHSKQKFGDGFLNLNADQKHSLLLDLEDEAGNSGDPASHYYIMMKQLTIWGYFTSETAARELFYYDPAPNHYDACIPYKKGDKVPFSSVGRGGAGNAALHHIERDSEA